MKRQPAARRSRLPEPAVVAAFYGCIRILEDDAGAATVLEE